MSARALRPEASTSPVLGVRRPRDVGTSFAGLLALTTLKALGLIIDAPSGTRFTLLRSHCAMSGPATGTVKFMCSRGSRSHPVPRRFSLNAQPFILNDRRGGGSHAADGHDKKASKTGVRGDY